MIRKHRHIIASALIAADVAATLGALLAAYLVRFHTNILALQHGVPPAGPYLVLAPVMALVWPLAFSLQGLYGRMRPRSRVEETVAITASVLVATMLVFGADAYLRVYWQRDLPAAQNFQYSRAFMGLFLAFDVALVALARTGVWAAISRARARGFNSRRILIVGGGSLGETLAQRMLVHADYGFRVVGFVDDDVTKQGTEIEALPVLGTTAEVIDVVRKHSIDQVYVALPLSAHERLLAVLEETSREGLEVSVVPDIVEYLVLRAGLEELDGIPIINLSDEPIGGFGRMAKRAVDVSVSLLLLAGLLPFLAAIAAAVRLSSRGPALYRQVRMGLDGKPFVMVKFRTMMVDAESASGPVFATEGDGRAFGVGRWLRRLSLDELPQLWNVLKGEMSLVGPRPERPQFVEEFKDRVPQYMYRHRVKSGITGWAQVHGWRGNTSIERRIEHDLYYIQNWSLGLDLKIMWMTLRHGILHENAY